MVPHLNTMLTMLAFGTPALLLAFFLPALIELKKPKDCGPRIIPDDVSQVLFSALTRHRLVNIEEEQKLAGAFLHRLAAVTAFLPNLEA